MMYSNKLAVAVKTNGKVLREVGDTVYLPFGSEYSLFIKNLNNVRASVSITIDGENIAGEDGTFVVYANGSIDIERYLRGGNLSEGNRFKFIERTDGIEQHRGIGVEDGLLRVEYRFEKPRPVYRKMSRRRTDTHPRTLRGSSATRIGASGMSFHHDASATMDVMSSYSTKSGITTEGSISDQQFQTIPEFPLEAESHVIVLKLMGETEENIPVSVPVTTRTKPICNKCNTRASSYNTQYCGQCGTSLQLVG